VENVVHVGQKFTCREDLLVRVAEDCEKKQKVSCCSAGDHAGPSEGQGSGNGGQDTRIP